MATPSPASRPPRFSVIVTAHGRREYLLEAVRSVNEGSPVGGGIEILVVKDFTDPALDAALDAAGARRIETDEAPLGAKLARGLEAARGELIAFLEDDDAYVPGRLAHVDALFRADAQLGFYRNGQERVGPDGRPLPPEAYGRAHRELAALGRLEVAPGELDRKLPELVRIDPDFNLSSIVVASPVLAGRAEELRPLEAAVDSFVFYAALEARRGLLIEARPWTRYRVHASNVSTFPDGGRDAEVRRWVEYQARFLASFEPILSAARNRGPRTAARLALSAYYGTWVLHRLLTGRGGRGALLADLARYWRGSPMAALRFRRDLTLWALAGLISPRAARRAYLRRRGGRDARPGPPAPGVPGAAP